ncbi:MAG TPA: secretion protein F [Rikenellaceae bacterium]|jgi:tight adherence protein C|nr:secretion protein F [Rikenellaceae bacterium]
MTILIFAFGILLAIGLFLISADLLKLPSIATQKAMLSAGKQGKEKAKTVDALLMGWAVKLAKYIPMDEYKKSRMKNTLNAAGMNLTPEEFIASAILKSGIIALLIIPCLMILPLIAPILMFLSIIIYFKEIRKADEILKIKKEKIEVELPRFVATITQELKASRDVLSIIENYKKNAGEEFADELDILTADMRSSSYEAALTRFEARINSPMLSDITRGLIGVLRGDDGSMYFQMLSHDMKQLELQRLKAQAMKIPPKIRVFSFVMLMCFLMTYMAIIVYEIIRSLSGMF